MVKTRKFLSAAIVLALLFLAGVVALPQPVNAAQNWVVTIPCTTATEGSNNNLAFGTDTVATDSFDAGIDIPHPPPGPGVTADSYFAIVHATFPQLDADYRLTLGSTAGSTIAWSLYTTSVTETMTLTWGDIGAVGGFPVNASLVLSGGGQNINMRAQPSASFSGGTYGLTITLTRLGPPDEVWVDDDWTGSTPGDYVNGHVFGYDAFDEIQDGIDGVASSTVHVLDGYYAAFNVTDRTDLEILGQQDPEVTGSSNNGGSTPPTMAWVTNSTDIVIDGLYFDGWGALATYGIYYEHSTGSINDVQVDSVQGNSDPTGYGIRVCGFDNDTVHISDSVITHCEVGVYVEEDTATITGCWIRGRGAGYNSTGVRTGPHGEVTIEGTEIYKCRSNGGSPPWGCGVYVIGCGGKADVGCCCNIHHNYYGIYVVSGGELTANGNNIEDNYGYGLYSEVMVIAPAPSVSQNGGLDAENNWWGHVSGPDTADNPDGQGDDVHGYVDYRPWLDAPCPGGKPVGPNAEFSADPTRGLRTLCVDFTDESTRGPCGPIDTWQWDFGDGDTSTEQNPTHCYRNAGAYTVSLTVTDTCEASDTETRRHYIVVLELEEEEAAPAEPAKMVVCYLTTSATQVVPGQELIITANVCNNGGERATHTVLLRINGNEEQSRSLGVSPGACKTVIFKVAKSYPGTYQVTVGGQETQFTVLAPVIKTTTVPTPGQGITTAGIVVIVIIGIVLVLAIVFIVHTTKQP